MTDMDLKKRHAKADAQVRQFNADRNARRLRDEYGYVQPEQLRGWRKPTEPERALIRRAEEKKRKTNSVIRVLLFIAALAFLVAGAVLRQPILCILAFLPAIPALLLKPGSRQGFAGAAGDGAIEVLDCIAFCAESGNEGGEYVTLSPAVDPGVKCAKQFRIDGSFTARKWRDDPDAPFLLARIGGAQGEYMAFAVGFAME